MIDAQFCYRCSTGTIDAAHWWTVYLVASVEERKKCLMCQIRKVE